LLSLRPADGQELSKELIEDAANRFYTFGLGAQTETKIIIRSGELGAYVKDSEEQGVWIDAFWAIKDVHKVVDVTGRLLHGAWLSHADVSAGAGNAFLGGLAAGLSICDDDIRRG